MRSGLILQASAILLVPMADIAHASPIHCPDEIVDAIMTHKMAPEACCSYGVCLGDVVVAMNSDDALASRSSALRYLDPRVPTDESPLTYLAKQLAA